MSHTQPQEASMIQFDFTGQRVLVVGGTSGINRGIARAFALARRPCGGGQSQRGEGAGHLG